MLRRTILYLLSIIGLTAWAADDNAAEPTALTADKCLQAAPSSVFDMIEGNTLLDMMDYYHAGSTRASRNVLGGDCYITDDTAESLVMVGGNDITYQLFVLNPTDKYPIIGVIETLNLPIPDSTIKFYNRSWVPLTLPLLPETTLKQWLGKNGKKHQSEVEEQLPFIFASYHYDPETKQLTMTNNTKQYYLESDTPEAMKYVNDNLVYVWDGRKFKLAK